LYSAHDIFEPVCDLLDGGLARRPRSTFQAVRLAEELVQERLSLRMIGIALQFEQQFADRLAVFHLLGLKRGPDLGHDLGIS
jgi:hypothetical protein